MIVPREDLLTPGLPYNSNSPLATIVSAVFQDEAPSPPKRPRTLTDLGVFDEFHSIQRFDFLASIPRKSISFAVQYKFQCRSSANWL